MCSINIHEAKTHLPRLVEEAARGEAFVIAKAGQPLVKVVPLGSGEGAGVPRLGFLSDADQLIPNASDTMDQEGAARLFEGED